MFIIKNLTIIFLLLLFGCADKSHTVINTYNPGDNNLTCAEIQNEVIKAELIIDAVKKDKESISGAEVLDAVMWGFIPAITKGQNHKKAVEAANARIERLEILKEKMQCASSNANNNKKNQIEKRLKQLQSMYDAGDLSKEEYEIAVDKLFD